MTGGATRPHNLKENMSEMTKLTKRITRKGRTEIDGRPVVLSLLPGDCVEVRLYGTRQAYTIDANSIWWICNRAAAAKKVAEKRKARKLKRLGAL